MRLALLRLLAEEPANGYQLIQRIEERSRNLWTPSPGSVYPTLSQLADEGLIVLGKVVEGTLAADLKVGIEMELTTMPLFTDDDGVERIVYAWRIAS